jgi:DNA-directed RNA polymerase subunit beta
MNIGQTFETQLGLVANALGTKFAVPLFAEYERKNLEDLLTYAGFQKDGKMTLHDGRTGVAYENQVTVGYMHILKLIHIVEDKIHARSVGPYSLITQQPL